MTRIIIQTDDEWTRKKITSAIQTEIEILKKAIEQTRKKILQFEKKYGALNRQALFGKIDDMELVEWEGEVETLNRMREKLKSLKEIVFEYQ